MTDKYKVYMVECSDKSIYTGIAKDVDKRLKQHSKGIGSKYVRARLQIKSWSKDKKEQWINAYLDGYER